MSSMTELLQEQIDTLLAHLGERTFDDWYSDGMEIQWAADLEFLDRDQVLYAVGYLRGAAEITDMTVLEMLNEYGVTLEREPRAQKRIHLGHGVYVDPCPKCHSTDIHRCKTGQCVHCDTCDHAWVPKKTSRKKQRA